MYNSMLKLAKNSILACLRLYQKTLSPDHGVMAHAHPEGFCRFYPTCSEYAYQTIDKHGVFVGTFRAIWRVIRCNPFNRGGIDPVK